VIGSAAVATAQLAHGEETAPAPAAPLQKPGKEAVRRPPRTLRQAWARAVGGVICTACEQPNPRSAHFCRICGAVLVGTPPVVVTRWQRLVGRPASLAAGQRPGWTKVVAEGPRRIPRRAALIAGGVVLVVVLAVLCAWLWVTSVGDWAGRMADDVRRDVYPYYDPIRPAKVSWNPKTLRHPGLNAFDRDLTTYWLSPATRKQKPATGIGGYLVAHFNPPADLDRVGIYAGDPVGKQLAPSKLRLGYFRWERGHPIANNNPNHPGRYLARPDAKGVFTTPGRNGKLVRTTNDPHKARIRGAKNHWVLVGSTGLTLANKPGFQKRSLNARDVGLVVITVKGVYDATSPGTAALTEVEFFRKH
jgi:hypothetical protein